MARFFKSLDEESKEIKKNTSKIFDSEDVKVVNKNDKKILELEKRAEEVVSSGKHFDKLFKKFIVDLKKYEPFFNEGKIPSFVEDLFIDERISKSKQLTIILDEYRGHKENKPANESNESLVYKGVKGKEIKKPNLDSILELENDDTKEKCLVEYLDTECTDEELRAISTSLFFVYFRRSDSSAMMDTIKRLLLAHKTEMPLNFLSSLNSYMLKIYNLIQEPEFDKFEALLDLTLPFKYTPFDSIRLGFYYFKKGRSVENEDLYFKLLKLVRENNWNDSSSYFNKNKDALLNISEANDKSIYLNVIAEYALFSAKNGDFLNSFNLLTLAHESKVGDFLVEIYCLCVILNHQIKKDKYFRIFIENFKHFDSNVLSLPSSDRITEIQRAFFLFHNFDYKLASEIIVENSGIECENILRDQVLKTLSEVAQV